MLAPGTAGKANRLSPSHLFKSIRSHARSRVLSFIRHRQKIPARALGWYCDKLDGLSDLLARARGASVLDIGCNRGLISLQFAIAGADAVHGCDIFEPGVQIARQNLSEFPAASRFEVVDLTGGAPALEDAFGLSYRSKYDIVLLLAVYHKLRRVMAREDLTALVWHLAARTGKYFAYRSLPEEVEELDAILTDAGLRRVQFSEISMVMENPAAIWTSLPRPIQARMPTWAFASENNASLRAASPDNGRVTATRPPRRL
jgi:SAM-dependent methyltransferase